MYYSTFLFKFVLYLSAVLMSSRRSVAQRVSVTFFLSNLDKSSITVADTTVYFQLISFFSLLYLWFIAQVPKTRLEPSWAYPDRRKVSKFEGACHKRTRFDRVLHLFILMQNLWGPIGQWVPTPLSCVWKLVLCSVISLRIWGCKRGGHRKLDTRLECDLNSFQGITAMLWG